MHVKPTLIISDFAPHASSLQNTIQTLSQCKKSKKHEVCYITQAEELCLENCIVCTICKTKAFKLNCIYEDLHLGTCPLINGQS